MYNIYYSLADNNWQGQERNVCCDTAIQAFSVAVKLVREALSAMEVDLVIVGRMEYVIWAFGKCKGYLSITEHSPKT